MLNPVQNRVAALETLDLGGPNVPRGVAELQEAWDHMTELAHNTKKNVNVEFWDGVPHEGPKIAENMSRKLAVPKSKMWAFSAGYVNQAMPRGRETFL